MFGNRVQIIRDTNTSLLSNNVFTDMKDILSHFEPETKPVEKSSPLPLISVEQAIKELLEMENEINKKES